MNVSMQFIQMARSANAGVSTTLHEVDLDMALTLSTALTGQQDAELETLIVVEGTDTPPHELLTAHVGAFPSWTGWLRNIRTQPVAPSTLLH
jgi:hypothetical protein